MKLTATWLWILSLVPAMSMAAPADDLMTKLKAIKTFEGDFTQAITDEKGKTLDQSKGHLQVKRPGRFYWKSEEPDELLVVADGKTIWTYDIELEQIVKQDQADSLGQSPAALLAGEVVDLGKEYDIKLINGDACNSSECFALKPKGEGQFKSIHIGFDGERVQLIHMQDALDQTINTKFSQVTVNGNVDDKLFDFTPPPGVDVIEGNN